MNKVEEIEKWIQFSQTVSRYVINEKILEYIRLIDEKCKDYEFVLYLEGDPQGNELIFNKKPIIPPQTIHHDYVTPYWTPSGGYWGLVHKHPEPFIRFSGNDQIYTHMYPFSVSFLWCGGHLVQIMFFDKKIPLEKIHIISGQQLEKTIIKDFIIIKDEVELPFICDPYFLDNRNLCIENKNWILKIDQVFWLG